MDNFIECLIKKKTTVKDAILSIAIILAFILLVLLYLKYGSILFLTLIPWAIWGVIVLLRNLRKEYEYVITGNVFDIDVIRAKSSRKRVITFKISSIEVCAPYTKDFYDEYSSANFYKKIDASVFKDRSDTYFLIINKQGEREIIFFTPSPAMIDLLKRIIPSKVK